MSVLAPLECGVMARKKEDPNQYSLFELLGESTHDLQDNAKAGLSDSGNTAERDRAQRQVRGNDQRLGDSDLGESGRSHPELEGQDRPAGSRRDDARDSSSMGQTASRGDRSRRLAGTASPADGGQPPRGRGRTLGAGDSGVADSVDEVLGHPSSQRHDARPGERTVAGRVTPVDQSGRITDAGARTPGQAISDRTGFRADAGVRNADQASTRPAVETNLAAISAAVAHREGKTLSDAEKQALRNYRSWGAFPEVFDETNDKYADARTTLRELLTEEEYDAARRTVLTAFYTPPELTSAIWQGLSAAGFNGGRVLEPGVGTGGFIDQAPDNSEVVGIERDPMSALIANARYPQAQIRREDFATTDIADNAFIATVGNVPFSQTKPYDPAHNRAGLSTHNYFISKSFDLTAPGGYVAVISSQHTADSAGRGQSSVQQYLTDRADFVTGVRLPGGKNGAFSTYSGTEVGTDVLVFRVREDDQDPTERTELFRRKQNITVNETSQAINQFFADNPDHVLGQWEEVSTQYGLQLGVRRTSTANLGDEVAEILTRDITGAVRNGYGLTATMQQVTDAESLNVAGLIDELKQQLHQTIGAMRYSINEDGTYNFQQLLPQDGTSTQWTEVRCAKKYQQEWKQIIDLRDTTEAVLEACRNGDESLLPALRAQLNEQYDGYVDKYGPLNRYTVQAARPKSPERIEADFAKKTDSWRKHHPVDDRPFEGELPAEVIDQLWDEAKQPATSEQKKQLHLAGALKKDPYITAVLALEFFDEETQHADKGPLFSTNPLRTIETPTSADTLADAVVIAQNHGLDLTTETLGDLLGSHDQDGIARQLTEDKLAFRNPHNANEWMPASRYLSGALYPKIAVAEELAATDSRFEPNVQALKEALPERVTHGIKMSLGATWIPDDAYRDFVIDTLGIPAWKHDDVRVYNRADEWFVRAPKDWPGREDADLKWGVRARNAHGKYNFKDESLQTFSHDGVAHAGNDATVYSAAQLIEDTMNMKPPQLNMSKEAKIAQGYDETSLVVHRKASSFAGSKVEGLERHFSQWVAQDPQRYERLITAYNETLNGVVAPHYDGSQREIAGISDRFTPYPYQLNAVERMLNEPGVLLNHVVGAGKTGSMLMGAMELKRLGVAKQPWMVVPNHLLEQVGIEAKQWFPGANILVESREGSNQKDNRQTLMAQAAANDWDLVLVSMSSFGEMSVSAEFLEDYKQQAIAEYTHDIQAVEEAETDEQARKQSVRRLEQKRDAFEASIQRKIDKVSRGDTIPWENTGGDYLIIDEAHNYKNLRRVSKLEDLAEAGSNRATDLDVKLKYLRSVKGSHHPIVTFATGTPIANSIAEIYTMQSYLRPDLLEECGMHGVNSWAQNFTSKRSEIGFTAGNKIKPQTRIGSYENLAELAQLCSPMADTITREDIPRKLPTVKGGETTVVEFEVGQETQDFIQDLSWREDHQPDNPKIDNALKIMTDGKNATLAPELANLPPDKGVGRVNAVVTNVLNEWKENRDNQYLDQRGELSPNLGGLQVIFCDRGVPKPDGSFSIYEAIREQLVENGMDKDRIRFIHDWDNNRTQLFDDCNNGKVDVLIANTAKLGTGANIQSRGVAIHHVDVPWRPADVEQQDGRFFRQGNQNEEVARYTYVGHGTYDGHSWSTLERKATFINQFWNADRTMRSMQPLEDSDLDAMAQNKAIATGNPDFVRKAELAKTVEKLETESDEHIALAASNVHTRQVATQTIARLQRRLDNVSGLAENAQTWAETPLESRTWHFGDNTQDNREDATDALIKNLYEVMQSRTRTYQDIGTIGGVPFRARFTAMDQSVEISTPAGAASKTPEKWIIDPRLAHSGISPKEIKSRQQGLLTQLENSVRNVPNAIETIHDEIAENTKTIEDIDQTGSTGDFPRQEELDSARAELKQVNDRLAAFDSSEAEVRRVAEYNQRLASKGRSPGYTLELNPTAHMRAERIPCHPDSQPIITQASTTALLDPPDKGDLHPDAQASLDFIDGLGLGTTETTMTKDTSDAEDTFIQDHVQEEDNDNEDGHEM
ncbi:TPA: hypothetical protein JAK05_002204 [Corynebacterium striatum]|nr:hypothetical protein [Corynebacterium striatum]HAT6564284.1 hypothetical protein [Corynebacterium striatum]HAT6569746.1 hypothetical protein [Corynebacterium striatum]